MSRSYQGICFAIASNTAKRVATQIIALDDVAIASIDDLHSQLTDARVGVPIPLTIVRDGKKELLHIVPAEAPE